MNKTPNNYNWGSSKKRYEWKNEYLTQGFAPRDEELEKELFGIDNHVHSGINFSKYETIPVRVIGENPPPGFNKFEDANLHPCMKENVALARYIIPTPVQRHSISIVTAGRDLMACAQTGSGKTAAFLIPTCSALFGQALQLISRPAPHEGNHWKARPLVLIIAPTRELCCQIFDEARRFCYRSMLRPCVVYGGAGVNGQLRELEKGCDILVAAPGRLLDFIDRGKIDLSHLRYLVLDEADRMLDMGFEKSIREIVERKGMNRNRITLMYSATFPKEIRRLARDFLKPNFLFLKVGRVGGTTTDITQKVLWVEEQDKRERVYQLLTSQPPCRTLIFVDTKRNADSLDQYLFDHKLPTTSIHGDRSQMEREDALLAFKAGTCPILVATAVVARGIDVKNVMHVINYDMPPNIDEYIHRIGRTARVGNAGLATSFYNHRNSAIARDLTKLLIECAQEVPSFLESYRTNDMRFQDDEDDF
ncbi:P-loop containing nucleoside triphosphate hydrolase protein [Cokeromyces recurvatus]|uniref:P-loop containing nucleoside triphosphate hydrolase protein n=1 Tax=Cokeromyces recurvatus TaxID=90255 RepID=UPI0022209057|nr:P-loop containing nucleoside triphosphate hydrolase protein [Cokeromyces recurvatus]KAI7899208.1 P-loop containing nucleoside triphosphate hydrolase protein [Cokeromyces recurvatus]